MSGQPLGIDSPSRSRALVSRVLAALEIPALIAVPAALGLCAYVQMEQAALFTMVVAIAAVGVFLAGFETSRPALRQIMPAVVLGAIAAAGRVLFAPVPDFKPVSAVCILAGAVFGRRSGFLVGALAALVSNFSSARVRGRPGRCTPGGSSATSPACWPTADGSTVCRRCAFMDFYRGCCTVCCSTAGTSSDSSIRSHGLRRSSRSARRCPSMLCTGQPRSRSCLRSTRLGAGSSSASSASTPWRTAGRRPASGRVLQCCPTDWKGSVHGGARERAAQGGRLAQTRRGGHVSDGHRVRVGGGR